MTYFIRNGSSYFTTNEANVDITQKVPTGTYTVLEDKMRGFYLEKIPNLNKVAKVYGNLNQNVDRIIRTFEDRPSNTGILLQGEKGSGKTLLAKVLSHRLLEKDVITLAINTNFSGEAFNSFISSITQPCMIFFDEFEKLYEAKQQQELLTLLDGTHDSKKLFVVTINNFYAVNDYMKNRPGRFFYRFNYDGLDSEFIREYCEDTLLEKTRIESVVSFAKTFAKFNFDILKAIVEEMNRYGENVAEVVHYLNASPMSEKNKFKIISCVLLKETREVEKLEKHVNDGYDLNPFEASIYTSVKLKTNRKDDDDSWDEEDDYANLSFTISDLISMKNGQFHFQNEDAIIIIERDLKVQTQLKNYMDI